MNYMEKRMRKIIFLLVIVSLINLFLPSVEAIDDKKPSLKVIYQRDKDAINKGETIKINVYFPGDGNISIIRCTIYYNGQYYENITYKTTKNHTEYFNLTEGAVTSFIIPIEVFNPLTDVFGSPTTAETGARIEGSGPSVAPLRLWLNTKSDIPAGNHYIILLLSYTNGVEWFTYEKNIEFHINDVFEQNPWLIPLIIALISIFITFVIEEIRHKEIKKGT